MPKIAISFTTAFLVLLSLPFFSAAETREEIQAKIDLLLSQVKVLQEKVQQTPTTPPTSASVSVSTTVSTSCISIARALTVGSRGSDVTALQIFLKARGYWNEEPTGYFGLLTQAAVQRMQAANNIVSFGTPDSNGFGALGPRTRALFLTLCRGSAAGTNPTSAVTTAVPPKAAATTTVSAAATVQCPQITSMTVPASSCGGSWQKLMSLGCHVGWKCVLPSSSANKPPVISSIDGPLSLGLNSFASWKVNAIDPEGGMLTYSVIWGDEAAADILLSIAGLGGSYTSSATMSHSFSKAGTRFVEFSVKDIAGNIASAVISVKVASGAPMGTYKNPVTPATPSAASCITPWGSQVVISGAIAYWQPFFTEGTYFATTSPLMRCDNGGWKKCDTEGNNCQTYTVPTSIGGSGAALRSYPGTIGTSCPKVGATLDVSVPPGTQLCQWLSCTITTQVQTVKLRCTDGGWTDFVR